MVFFFIFLRFIRYLIIQFTLVKNFCSKIKRNYFIKFFSRKFYFLNNITQKKYFFYGLFFIFLRFIRYLVIQFTLAKNFCSKIKRNYFIKFFSRKFYFLNNITQKKIFFLWSFFYFFKIYSIFSNTIYPCKKFLFKN